MATRARVHHDGDDAFVAWSVDERIPGCRGFALFRRRNGVEEVVRTWVGFEGERHDEGERRASTDWPIQKFQWSDYMASPGDEVSYRVVPMVGPDRRSLRPDAARASPWTAPVRLEAEAEGGIASYFNRGIVAAQWVSRRLGDGGASAQGRRLGEVIAKPGDPLREYLYGPLGEKLLEVLGEAAAHPERQVYAALFELDDPQLLEALAGLGPRAHVLLANGAAKRKGEDENSQARDRLRGVADLRDRMCAPRALGHNKFMVVEEGGVPRWTWTGSLNWTKTGLCTQANNAVLVDDRALAEEYRLQWDRLAAEGDGTSDGLKEENSKARTVAAGPSSAGLWFTPTLGRVDLEDAKAAIDGAESAILFLMFNPGPRDSLLNAIIDKARAGSSGPGVLYVRGALNQDPGTEKNPVGLFDSENTARADFDVTLPRAVDAATEWFRAELLKLPKAHAMVHSKVVVIDPFGDSPVVITGSHNLGPTASGKNDENLLIVRGAPALADAYAVNVMSVYNQYRWRFRRHSGAPWRRWKGLRDDDAWQDYYFSDVAAAREMRFWT